MESEMKLTDVEKIHNFFQRETPQPNTPKIGEVSKKDFGYILNSFREDTLDDYFKEVLVEIQEQETSDNVSDLENYFKETLEDYFKEAPIEIQETFDNISKEMQETFDNVSDIKKINY